MVRLMGRRVRVDIEGGIALVSLDRGERHNALDLEMFVGLEEAMGAVVAAGGVRAVVLAGSGPSFCSGLDLEAWERGGLDPRRLVGRPRGEEANLAQRVAYGWRNVPVPVVAAIQGACFGGGLQIALGADVRLAAPDSRFSIMEVKVGLVPDMGLSQTLPRLVREDVARELTYTARVIGAEEAVDCGLVTRICPDPLEGARDLAGRIAERSPDAVRAAKRLFGECWGAPPGQGLRRETALIEGLIGSPNQLAAARAAATGEAAEFVDPPADG
jgi:enoyl-CoA hydratase/carnithine racemase